jgi:heptosyltransferase-1
VRIALIKSSSMGDVIHALPVVSDLIAARPGIEIDWLVEESFADLPGLHPGVDQTLAVAVRRWRRTPRRPWAEVRTWPRACASGATTLR